MGGVKVFETEVFGEGVCEVVYVVFEGGDEGVGVGDFGCVEEVLAYAGCV